MSQILLKNVKFEYDNTGDYESDYRAIDVQKLPVYAVNDVSLAIEEGQFVAIVGRNGSGKSTLAKLLNALLLPSYGDVVIDGKNTKDKDRLIEIRKIVGMVFQNPDNQMVASIVEDDLAFGPENIGIKREEISNRIRFALQSVNMEEYRHSTPSKLSGGQKQRIAIAGMLALMPKVLVLDESTAMLDPKGRKEVLDVVKMLNKEMNMTIILITHYMDEVLDCDRVIVLNEGKVLADSTPTAIFNDIKMLNTAGLDAPRQVSLVNALKGSGINIITSSLNYEEVVEAICQLL